jgi:hypothetical protein
MPGPLINKTLIQIIHRSPANYFKNHFFVHQKYSAVCINLTPNQNEEKKEAASKLAAIPKFTPFKELVRHTMYSKIQDGIKRSTDELDY